MTTALRHHSTLRGCLWGTNYLPLCPSSPHPHPTPLTHPLISVGFLFWLNGLKHKLPPSRPKLSLVHENKRDKRSFCKHEALLRARHRKPGWKTESAIAWGAPIVQIKRLWLPILIPLQGKQETGVRLLASLQNERKSAFESFRPTECMTVKMKHLFANP